MEEMRLYTHEEMLDAVLGKKGSPRRDKHDSDIDTFLMGEVIRKSRLRQNLTQEQLGERMGVKGAWVSRIERGENLTLSTISRVLRALDIHASLDLGEAGKISLW